MKELEFFKERELIGTVMKDKLRDLGNIQKERLLIVLLEESPN